MSFEEIINLVTNELGSEAVESVVENSTPKGFITKSKTLTQLMSFLHQSDKCYFDSLSCITGIDNGPEANTMEVIYHLYSIPFDHHLMVKVELERSDDPTIDSLTGIWKTADWHEREVFDLLGIRFANHPDLRRILMPADWDGHPLRKDYKEQEYYRGVKVES